MKYENHKIDTHIIAADTGYVVHDILYQHLLNFIFMAWL